MKMWMIVGVETDLDWPAEETSIDFMGNTFILRPPDGDSAPDVRLQYDYPQFERDTYEKICRFLSALVWRHRRPARTRLSPSCTAPMRVGRGICCPPLCKDYHLSEGTQSPTDQKARILLALYREAISVDNIAYGFLGYFKIINVFYDKSSEQKKWINDTILVLKLNDKKVKQRISDLIDSQKDIGKYLYQSGRCAVAHAHTSPVLDPDNPEDILRLSADLPVVRALSEYLIENYLSKEITTDCS